MLSPIVNKRNRRKAICGMYSKIGLFSSRSYQERTNKRTERRCSIPMFAEERAISVSFSFLPPRDAPLFEEHVPARGKQNFGKL